jgi:hypothetical protein
MPAPASNRLAGLRSRLGGAAPLALYALSCGIFRRFTVDDAFIAYRHARHLGAGLGPVMNPGERVEGVSSLPWTALLGGLAALGLEPHRVAPWLALACGAACVLAAGRVAARGGAAPESGRRAALLTATGLPLVVWSASGMETAAHALVVLGLVAHQARALERRAGMFGSGVWLGLAAAMRPEGILFAAPVVLSEVSRGTDRRRLARLGLGLLVVVVPLVALRRAYYGDWLPNPVHAKAALGLAALGPGALYAGKLLASWPLGFALAWRAARRRDRGLDAAAGLVALCIAAQLLFTPAVGGDRFPGQRFLAPVWPLLAVGMAWALEQRAAPAGGAGRHARRLLAAAVVAGLVLVLRPDLVRPLAAALFDLARAQRPFTEHAARLDAEARHFGLVLLGVGLWIAWSRRRTAHPAATTLVLLVATLAPAAFDPDLRACRRRDPAAVYGRQVGEWLRDRMPPGTLVATNAAGALPYFSRLPVIDMLGLTDRHIARRPADRSQWIGHEKGDGAYVLARRPDVIVLGGPEGSVEPWSFPGDRQIAAAPEFHRDWVLERARLRDLEFVYYRRRGPLDAARRAL